MQTSTDWTVATSFDRYARLVRRTVGVPVGLVTVVEPDRQVFPGALGLPEPYQSTRQTPLSHSFCQYVVQDAAPLVVADARLDERLQTNLAIRDLHVIAYAGWPLTDATGQVIGSLCAIHDVPHEWSDLELENLADLAAACSAELAQRELAGDLTTTVDQLHAAVEELQRSNENLEAFAGQVSHDLRNPLAALVSSLELLDDLQGDDEGVSTGFVLERARRSATRMADLVHDVLEFARVGGQLFVAPVDVPALVEAAVEDLHLTETAPGTEIVVVGDLPGVSADAVQLLVVVQNLLANAVKHAPGSTVEVVATVEAGRWSLAIADHGPGIPAEDRQRVLDSFVRLDQGVAGSGLGLATCRRVVQAHGGELEIADTPGGGTTVRVTLPAAR